MLGLTRGELLLVGFLSAAILLAPYSARVGQWLWRSLGLTKGDADGSGSSDS